MTEWSIVAVSKTVDPYGSVGSNPTLSAIFPTYSWVGAATMGAGGERNA